MYRFTDEQTAIAAEQWIVDKASELGIPFSGTTSRWAIPQAERLAPVDPTDIEDLGEPTGKWLFPEIPQYTLDTLPQTLVDEFFNTFNAEIV